MLVSWSQGQGQGALCLHSAGHLERVVAQPQLPDDAAVVAVILGVGEVFSVQVRLETAEMSYKQSGQDRVDIICLITCL